MTLRESRSPKNSRELAEKLPFSELNSGWCPQVAFWEMRGITRD